MSGRQIIWFTLALLLGCKREEPAANAEARVAPGQVTMTAEAVAAAGVTTVRARAEDLVVKDELPGTVEAPRDGLAIVNTRLAGVVESLGFDLGDRVDAGQTLATIRSTELAQAQGDYQRAQAAVQFAESALKRSEDLRAQGVLSERRLETDRLDAHDKRVVLAEATNRVRIYGGSTNGNSGVVSVTAPISGVIARRTANRGQAVEANSPLYTVVDASKVVLQLRAVAGTPVVPGTQISFTAEAIRGRTFTAVVVAASDLLDPETRRFFIRCSVDNSDRLLKPGMFVTAQLPIEKVHAVTVPEGSIQIMPEGPSVFVVQKGGFERRGVTPGARAEGRVAVETGLTEGEEVVDQGSFWVRTQLQRSELEE